MSLHFHETSDTIIVSFTGPKIPAGKIEDIGRSLIETCEVAARLGKRLVVDFRGVQSMSSAMVGKLIVLNRTSFQLSVNLRIAKISPNILELFGLTGKFRMDDDDPDLYGLGVPAPKPPNTLGDGATPPSG